VSRFSKVSADESGSVLADGRAVFEPRTASTDRYARQGQGLRRQRDPSTGRRARRDAQHLAQGLPQKGELLLAVPLLQPKRHRYRPGTATLKILWLGRVGGWRNAGEYAANSAGLRVSFSRPRPCRDPPRPAWRVWSRRQRCGMTGGPSGPSCRGSAAAS